MHFILSLRINSSFITSRPGWFGLVWVLAYHLLGLSSFIDFVFDMGEI